MRRLLIVTAVLAFCSATWADSIELDVNAWATFTATQPCTSNCAETIRVNFLYIPPPTLNVTPENFLGTALNPNAVVAELKRKVASLQEQWRGTRHENERLRQEIEQLRRREKQLEPSATPSHALAGNVRKLAEFVQLNSTSSISIANFRLQAHLINSVCKGFDAVNNDSSRRAGQPD